MATASDSDSQRDPLNPVADKSLPCKRLPDAEEIRRLDGLYPPFARTDVYGSMGIGSISVPASLHLYIASVTLFPLRAIFCLLLICFFYLVCLLATAFHPPVLVPGQLAATYANIRGFRRCFMTLFGRMVARALLFVIGFHFIKEAYPKQSIREDGRLLDQRRSGSAKQLWATCVISNHISWIDILYHVYAHPGSLPSFVAKHSVANVPLAGFVSKCLGCIYVEREGKSRSNGGVATVILDRMKASKEDPSAPVVLLFPEGTTSNGQFLLPFKTGAFLAGTAVHPTLLRYSGPFMSPAWETISGFRHIFLLLCQPWHSLEVTHLPLYRPSEEESQNAKLYAENVRKLMASNGSLQLSPMGLYDKHVYHALLQVKEPPSLQI